MRRCPLTPGRINVTREEFLAGIQSARARRADFAEMDGGRGLKLPLHVVQTNQPAPKERRRGRDWRRLDASTREAAVAAVAARVENGEGVKATIASVAAEYGIGKSTLSGFYHEARRARTLAGVIQEAAP